MLRNKINRSLLTLLISVSLLLFTGACKTKEHSSENQGYGGVTAKVVWPGSTDEQSMNSQQPVLSTFLTNAGIDEIRGTVSAGSGPAMTAVVKKFDQATGSSGIIDKVPVGNGRVLKIEALDSADKVLFDVGTVTVNIAKNEIFDVSDDQGPLTWQQPTGTTGNFNGYWGVTRWGKSNYN